MARAIDADAVKRRAWDIAEAWKDQGRDYEALLLESVVEQIVDTQPTLTPPNEALTLEALREMDGEPVWVKCLKPSQYTDPPERWRILEKSITGHFGVWNGDCALIERNYGTDWLAYRRPPEGDEDA